MSSSGWMYTYVSYEQGTSIFSFKVSKDMMLSGYTSMLKVRWPIRLLFPIHQSYGIGPCSISSLSLPESDVFLPSNLPMEPHHSLPHPTLFDLDDTGSMFLPTSVPPTGLYSITAQNTTICVHSGQLALFIRKSSPYIQTL